MKNIQLSIKQLSIYLLIAFLIGMGFGGGIYHILGPHIPELKERINNESVYVIEKECKENIQEEVVEPVDECPIKVDVSGALKEPGVYCFQEGDSVIDAIKKAGGFDNGVGLVYIARKLNLASGLKDEQKIYFPYTEELSCTLQTFDPITEEVEQINKEITSENEAEGSTNTNNDEGEGSSQNSQNTSCVNINTGSKEELTQLNGVGESTAEKIIEARPFNTINDLLNVSGIGEATFNKFKDNICL